MPMGNPLSPTIADIIMDDLLDKTLTELKGLHNIKIKLIVKYVDDVFAIVRRNDVEIILKTINKYHEKLQFTMETERNLSIPFLDVRIHREKEKILLNWYSKPISSGRIINFLSAQPLKYKINTARNLVTKIPTISHQRFRDENVGKIHEILKRNNYPIHMTKNLIEQALMKINKQHNNTSAVANTETKQFYSVTYVPKLTGKLPQTIKKNKPNITLAYKSNCTLSTIFTRTKSPIEPQQQSNIVYKIKCQGKQNEERNKIYIGTTKRSLSTRLSEHDADIRKKKNNTALAQHILTSGHTADLANTKILDRENREKIRYTLESLRIMQKRERTVNKKEDTNDIAATYLLCLQNTVSTTSVPQAAGTDE
ncbi:uncharacterized protein LOC118735060 [Rhagoletis pomonella]|uniref:uncharacterized protein LOC118735060 n=1 Tax=Rhagoletis pomonella TaxID=28610 RepID=UPI00177F0140|nr:uncharacterized protein LOC118735060 [Rhagoletis pomonella]